MKYNFFIPNYRINLFVMNVEVIQDIFQNPCYNLLTVLDELNSYFTLNCNQADINIINLVDTELIEDIKECCLNKNVSIYFGNTLGIIKCIIIDESGRKHGIFIEYKGLRKLCVTNADMPCSRLLQHDYDSLRDIIQAFTTHINDLSCYFYQLEQIDNICAVMEPANPNYGIDYRRIYLDDRTWLHVEVTADGLATNIHLIGLTEAWHSKLQAGLLQWDHDKDVIENILNVFDLSSFPFPLKQILSKEADEVSGPTCSICLCVELPDAYGLPQPLCKNYACGVFYHRICLFQWLIACSGNHQPAFGVATGLCPCCFQPITCSAKEHGNGVVT